MVEANVCQIEVTEELIAKCFEKLDSSIPEESKVAVLSPESCVGNCDPLFICSICLKVVNPHFVECSACTKINCHACIQVFLSNAKEGDQACPSCNAKFNPSKKPNRIIMKKLQELEFACIRCSENFKFG